MTQFDPARLANDFKRDGYISGIPILSPIEAASHRSRLETAEASYGTIHYRPKVHTILTSPMELCTHPKVLDTVEALIGPDILITNVTYVIKEAKSPSHVSWHQDLTFWGLSDNADDGQVSMWLALSPANARSGCMRMVPGSHTKGQMHHQTFDDETNVLFQSQTVEGVAEDHAVMCPLEPGEASFHHGWTLHASMPNTSDDRRIGLNVQYVRPDVRQTKHDLDTAILVRGKDRFNHFGTDIPASGDLEPEAVARHAALEKLYVETVGS